MNSRQIPRAILRRSFALVFLWFLFCAIAAQGAVNTAPPEAANPQVGHGPLDASFTGDMRWAIPVMTVPGRGLGYHIELGYQAGIRVDHEPSWTGDWNLNAGAVTRSVRGFPDEKYSQTGERLMDPANPILQPPVQGRAGWLVDPAKLGYAVESEKRDIEDYAYFNQPAEPDNYYLISGNYGGRLILGSDGTFYPERWEAARVRPEISGPNITGWTITNLDGSEYVYQDIGIRETKTIYRYRIPYVNGIAQNSTPGGVAEEHTNVVTVWPCVEIRSADKRSSVKFYYTLGGTHTEWVPNNTGINNPDSYLFDYRHYIDNTHFDDWYRLVQSEVRLYYLSRIETATYQANFFASARTATYDQTRGDLYKLDKIELVSLLTTGTVRRVLFDYYTGAARCAGKLTLKSITEVNPATGTALPATSFEYWDASLPASFNNTDAWGYYTSSGNYAPSTDPTENNPARAWSLKKITYPTGGWVNFDYEADRYNYAWGSQLGSEKFGGGIRLKRLKYGDGLGGVISYEYSYLNGIAYLSPESYWEDGARKLPFRLMDLQPQDVNYVGYEKVAVSQSGYGKTETEFNTYAPLGSVQAECQNGLPVQVVQYDSGGSLIQSQATIQYDLNPSPNDHWSEVFLPFNFLGQSQLMSGWTRVTSATSSRDGVLTTSEINYNTINGLVNEQIDVDVGASHRITRISYGFENGSEASSIGAKMKSKNMLTQGWKTQVYDWKNSTETLVAESETSWTDYYGDGSAIYPQSVYSGIGSDRTQITRFDIYDSYGHLLREIDAGGYVTDYFYGDNTAPFNNAASGLKNAYLTGTKAYYNANQFLQSEVAYNLTFGLPERMKDANGHETKYSFDGLGRLLKAEDPYDSAEGTATEYEYYLAGAGISAGNLNRLTTRTSREFDNTGIKTNAGHAFSDGLGRAIKAKQEGSPENIIAETEYNNAGLVSKVYKPYGEQTGSRNLYSLMSYSSDPLKRVISVMPISSSPGLLVETAYPASADGRTRVVKVKDENDIWNEQTQDAWGRAIEAREGNDSRRTTSQYDVLDRLVQIKDPRGLITEKAYDSLGRVIYSREPDLTGDNIDGSWDEKFIYDAEGNLIEKKGPEGDVQFEEIDGIGRVGKVYTVKNGTSRLYQDNHYDDYNFTGAPSIPTIGGHVLDAAKGRLTRVVTHNPNGEEVEEIYFYDKLGRVGQKVVRVRGAASNLEKEFSVEYEFYQGSDALKQKVVKSSGVVKGATRYEYYTLGWLSKTYVTPPGKAEQVVETVEYNPAGTIKKVTYGNQASMGYSYTDRDWLQVMDARTSTGTALFQRYFEFDNVGNIMKEHRGTVAGTLLAAYGYDWLYQLTSATDPDNYFQTGKIGLGYQYDLNGNRKVAWEGADNFAYEVNPINNQLLKVSKGGALALGYAYDKNGNITRKDETSQASTQYRFDVLNQLNQVYKQDASLNEVYTYDAAGMRVKKVDTNGKITYTLWEGVKVLYEEDLQGPTPIPPVGYNLPTPTLIVNNTTISGNVSYDDPGTIQIGPNIIIASGANVEFRATNIILAGKITVQNGATLIINATDTIYMDPNIPVEFDMQGGHVELVAGKNIYVSPERVLVPHVVLRIGTVSSPKAPDAPSGLTATVISGNQADLRWTDASDNETGFKIQRKSGTGSYGEICSVGAGVTNYLDTNLEAGTTYTYQILAYNNVTNSPPSNEATVTITLPAPAGLIATPGNGQVSLNWTASTGATSYNVKRSTTNGGPYNNIATGVTATTYTNTGLINGTTYYYVVSAVNAGGESGNSTQTSATPTAPITLSAPTGLIATPGNGQVSLSWTASTGATSYNVKRSTTNGGPYSNIAIGVTATTYTNTSLMNGTTYYYVVSAKNASGESTNSTQASATPTAPLSNHQPVASDGWLTDVIENTAKAFNLVASDADSDPLTYSIVGQPSHGRAEFTGGPLSPMTVTYTPDANFYGQDSFTFKVNDGKVDSNVATISITVSANNAPTVTISATDANASEPPGTDTGTFTVSRSGDTSQAISVNYSVTGSAINGTDYNTLSSPVVLGAGVASATISVTVRDDSTDENPDPETVVVTLGTGSGYTVGTPSSATVSIWDNDSAPPPSNYAPTISDIGDQTINEDGTTGAINFTVGDAETAADLLTVSGNSSDTILVPNGNIVFGGSGANRTVTVTPAASQSGTATITVTVSDGALSAWDTFGLTVSAVNHAPVATGWLYGTKESTACSIDLASHASDADGDSLTFEIVSNPTNGTVSPSGSVATYTPKSPYPPTLVGVTGSDGFLFRAYDGMAYSDAALISITVSSQSPPPIPSDHTVATPNIPTGASRVLAGSSWSYTTSGGTCLTYPSHLPVSYRFDWGDSSMSSWSADSSAMHTWGVAGTYAVRAQSQCSASVNSMLSSPLSVTVESQIARTGPFFSEVSSSQARVSWSTTNVFSRYGYIYWYPTDGSGPVKGDYTYATGYDQSYTITGLSANTAYYVEVYVDVGIGYFVGGYPRETLPAAR